MPKGITKDGLWRGQEPGATWVAAQEAPLCACGCGEHIVIKPEHRRRGIPKFIVGHHARVQHYNYQGVDKWVDEQQGKQLCVCGCGQSIVILPRHHCVGIPRYIVNHSPAPKLGRGPQHPKYKHDRSLLKGRRANQFRPWAKKIIFERCGGRCLLCGCAESLEYDHIIPMAKGGSNDPSNGQLLCANCHRKKTDAERRAQHAARSAPLATSLNV